MKTYILEPNPTYRFSNNTLKITILFLQREFGFEVSRHIGGDHLKRTSICLLLIWKRIVVVF